MTARDFMNAGFHSLGHETLETKTILGLSAIFTFLFVAGALAAGRSAISFVFCIEWYKTLHLDKMTVKWVIYLSV